MIDMPQLSSTSDIFGAARSGLSDADVDVIVTELSGWATVLDDPTSVLSEEETRRARALPGTYRMRFMEGRAFLRHVLASYVGCAPGELSFSKGPEGKPVLTTRRPDIRFNLSHSGGLAVCAVKLGDDIGVDVEVVREVRSLERIAGRVLPADSSAAVVRAPARYRLDAFLRAWTRREAVTKLLGFGLMALTPDPWNEDAAWRGVSTYDLELEPGWVGAVAVRTPSGPVSIRTWEFPSA
jgi:4'-phosphopantetheinyl transferase